MLYRCVFHHLNGYKPLYRVYSCKFAVRLHVIIYYTFFSDTSATCFPFGLIRIPCFIYMCKYGRNSLSELRAHPTLSTSHAEPRRAQHIHPHASFVSDPFCPSKRSLCSPTHFLQFIFHLHLHLSVTSIHVNLNTAFPWSSSLYYVVSFLVIPLFSPSFNPVISAYSLNSVTIVNPHCLL